METLSPALPAATDRGVRLARVKFVGLPLEACPDTLGPVLRDDPPVAGPQAAARLFRLGGPRLVGAIQLLLRFIASRVDGRPSAARP